MNEKKKEILKLLEEGGYSCTDFEFHVTSGLTKAKYFGFKKNSKCKYALLYVECLNRILIWSSEYLYENPNIKKTKVYDAIQKGLDYITKGKEFKDGQQYRVYISLPEGIVNKIHKIETR